MGMTVVDMGGEEEDWERVERLAEGDSGSGKQWNEEGTCWE